MISSKVKAHISLQIANTESMFACTEMPWAECNYTFCGAMRLFNGNKSPYQQGQIDFDE